MASIKAEQAKLTGAALRAYNRGLNDGANDARTRIRRHIARHTDSRGWPLESATELEAWITQMPYRAALEPGGMGKTIARPVTVTKRAIKK